jgi:hypothetical protein
MATFILSETRNQQSTKREIELAMGKDTECKGLGQ